MFRFSDPRLASNGSVIANSCVRIGVPVLWGMGVRSRWVDAALEYCEGLFSNRMILSVKGFSWRFVARTLVYLNGIRPRRASAPSDTWLVSRSHPTLAPLSGDGCNSDVGSTFFDTGLECAKGVYLP